MTETLRLTAVADTSKAVTAFRYLQRQLQTVGPTPQLARLQRDFQILEGQVIRAGNAIRGVAVPALAAFGASLSAAGLVAGLTGVSRALKSLSEGGLEPRTSVSSTGLTTRQLRALSDAGEGASCCA
jgi:hypothetical protein